MHFNKFPAVSVVITTKNESRNIKNCLESIISQTWQNLEIIVVDNASNDDTKSIALQYTKNVFDKGPERSAQRNFGMIEIAKSPYVIYIDADMLLSPKLIEACVLHIEKTGAAALHISETVLGSGYLSNVRRFERNFYDGTSIDGARFFKRDVFIQAGGFDEQLFVNGSGEDWDIDKKVRKYGRIELMPFTCESAYDNTWILSDFIKNRGVVFNPKYIGIYHNESDFDLKTYLAKKFYYSGGFSAYIKKWGINDDDIKKQFGMKYRYLIVFTENGKWKRLISRPDLVVGMYYLRILVGFVFIIRKLCMIYKKVS